MGKKIEEKIIDVIMAGAKHWLLILTILVILFVIPIVGYPFLMSTGNPVLQTIAGFIHLAYKITCHQLPDRSIIIFGYPMVVCARCFAIYAACLAGCFIFALVRKWLKIWSLKYYVIFCIPMAIDGFAQLFGVPIPRGIGPDWQLIWTTLSNNEWRVVTGAIFGLASSLYVMPYLEEIFADAPSLGAPAQPGQQPASPESPAK